MKLSLQSDHHKPLKINTLAHDFELLDVWTCSPLSKQAGPKRLDAFLQKFQQQSAAVRKRPGAARLLFTLREKLGVWFGWDDAVNTLPIPGCTETTLRSRLTVTAQSQQRWSGGKTATFGGSAQFAFQEVFRDEREAAFEISNRTVHALVHFSLLPTQANPRMAVYVKHRGWLGRVYMALIKPFRHFVVYPALLSDA